MYEPFGNEEDSLEFKLTLNGEVFDSEMVFPIIGQALVEGAILFYSDVRWVMSLDEFCLQVVKLLFEGLNLLDIFGFLLFLLLFFVDLLNLCFLFSAIFFLFLFLVIFYFLKRRLSTATYDAYILPPW